jgi:hypothetical protein
MGTLNESFENVFEKPWSSIYFNEMISKMFWTKVVDHGRKGVVVLKKGHW